MKETLVYQDISDAQKRIEDVGGNPASSTPVSVGNMGMLYGMRVYSNPLLTRSEPKRYHYVTRSQFKHLIKHMFKGITYHDRIQKKWNKRYGFKQVPHMVMMKNPVTNEDVIMAHPTIVNKLKEVTG